VDDCGKLPTFIKMDSLVRKGHKLEQGNTDFWRAGLPVFGLIAKESGNHQWREKTGPVLPISVSLFLMFNPKCVPKARRGGDDLSIKEMNSQ